MYEHPKLRAFTAGLDALFDEADNFLEEGWGGAFALHPNRPERGNTGNPAMDGLFEIIPDFTPGIGSEKGRGYLVSFRAATLERIPPEQFEFLMEETAAFIRRKLPAYFPGRGLELVRDGKRFKIIGDFSLGEA
ncbi:MAG: hypothetical protein LBE10_10695 [Treponema sp.]|jgi:hypothetical protein|nr:hypothetical protein [Treponema sp.]